MTLINTPIDDFIQQIKDQDHVGFSGVLRDVVHQINQNLTWNTGSEWRIDESTLKKIIATFANWDELLKDWGQIGDERLARITELLARVNELLAEVDRLRDMNNTQANRLQEFQNLNENQGRNIAGYQEQIAAMQLDLEAAHTRINLLESSDPEKATTIEQQRQRIQELATQVQKREDDIDLISESLLTEAHHRDWCGDFDRFIADLNPQLSYKLTPREQNYDVTSVFTVTITENCIAPDADAAEDSRSVSYSDIRRWIEERGHFKDVSVDLETVDAEESDDD